LATYGLTPADATLLTKEIADYEALIASASTAIAGRRALTAAWQAARTIRDLGVGPAAEPVPVTPGT